MKITLKSILLFVSLFAFSGIGYANQYDVVRSTAEFLREVIIEGYGAFPAKIDNVTYLTSIKSDKQYIIFDYKLIMDSKNITTNMLKNVVVRNGRMTMCEDNEFKEIMEDNNIQLLYRYEFSDKKTKTLTLDIDDFCY